MAHVRKQIRDGVKRLLEAGDAIPLDDLPWDNFYASDEVPPGGYVVFHVARESILRDPPEANFTNWRRGIDTIVRCVVALEDGDDRVSGRAVEDRLDELAVRVEKAMAADLSFGLRAGYAALVSVTLEPLPDECGSMRLDMVYTMTAWTPADQPDIGA